MSKNIFAKEKSIYDNISEFVMAIHDLALLGSDRLGKPQPKPTSITAEIIMELGGIIKEWDIDRRELSSGNYGFELWADKKSSKKVIVAFRRGLPCSYMLVSGEEQLGQALTTLGVDYAPEMVVRDLLGRKARKAA